MPVSPLIDFARRVEVRRNGRWLVFVGPGTGSLYALPRWQGAPPLIITGVACGDPANQMSELIHAMNAVEHAHPCTSDASTWEALGGYPPISDLARPIAGRCTSVDERPRRLRPDQVIQAGATSARVA